MSHKELKAANSATIHGADLEGSFTAGLSAFESVFDAMNEQEKTKLINLLQNTVDEIIEERLSGTEQHIKKPGLEESDSDLPCT